MNSPPHMSRPNLGQDFCAQTPVKANLLEHVNALDNFSCPHSVMSSNFIFSLPTQKPLAEEAMVSSSMACPIQNTERLQSAQVQKAWHALSNLQISCRNYPKPGKTLVVKDVSAEYSPDVGRTDLPSTCNIDKSCAHMQTHQYINGTNTRNSEAATFLGNLLPSSNFNVADAGKNLGRKVRSEHQWSTVLMLGCWMDHLATIVFIPAKGFCKYVLNKAAAIKI